MNRDYITVAEYAELRGISPQAVYKALRGKLKTYGSVIEIDAKPQKVLKIEALSADERTRFINKMVELNNGKVSKHSEDKQPTKTTEPTKNTAVSGADWAAAAFEERGRRLADLERMTRDQAQTIAELRSELAEKDKYIQEQADKVADLFAAALQVQPGNLLLMGAASRNAHEAQTAPEAAGNYEDMPADEPHKVSESAVTAARRRGFWSWLSRK